jgi:hypothetical protein
MWIKRKTGIECWPCVLASSLDLRAPDATHASRGFHFPSQAGSERIPRPHDVVMQNRCPFVRTSLRKDTILAVLSAEAISLGAGPVTDRALKD